MFDASNEKWKNRNIRGNNIAKSKKNRPEDKKVDDNVQGFTSNTRLYALTHIDCKCQEMKVEEDFPPLKISWMHRCEKSKTTLKRAKKN